LTCRDEEVVARNKRKAVVLETGKGGSLVGSSVEDGIKANHFENGTEALVGSIEHASATSTLELREGANDETDTGRVDITNAREIDGNVNGARGEEEAKPIAKGVFGRSEAERAIDIKNGDAADLADGDVERHGHVRKPGCGTSAKRREKRAKRAGNSCQKS
jgi:hypothetical protein